MRCVFWLVDFQVSRRASLGTLSWRLFFDGLAALPSTERARFEEERRVDQDVAVCFFALRQTQSLVECCIAAEEGDEAFFRDGKALFAAAASADRLKALKKQTAKTAKRHSRGAAAAAASALAGFLEEKLRQTIAELHALMGRVRKPQFALWALLHVCCLAFSKGQRSHDASSKELAGDLEFARSLSNGGSSQSATVSTEEASRKSKAVFVVPPHVLVSLLLFVRWVDSLFRFRAVSRLLRRRPFQEKFRRRLRFPQKPRSSPPGRRRPLRLGIDCCKSHRRLFRSTPSQAETEGGPSS